MLDEGIALSQITAHLSTRLGVTDVTLLPATDDPLRTFVQIPGGRWLTFQEYFVDRGHTDDVVALAYHGSAQALPAPGVIDAIDSADTVVIAPSNPPLSVWPILAIDGIHDAVARHPKRVAVSPLFGGTPLKGPADIVMRGVGLSPGTRGILEAYAGLIDYLYVDSRDRDDESLGAQFGVTVIADDTDLAGNDEGAAFARALLEETNR